MIKINNKGSFAVDVSIVVVVLLSIFAFLAYIVFSINKNYNEQSEKLQSSVDASNSLISSYSKTYSWNISPINLSDKLKQSKTESFFLSMIGLAIFIFSIFWIAFFMISGIWSIKSVSVPTSPQVKVKRKYVRKVPYNGRTNSGKTKLIPLQPLKAIQDPDDEEYVIIKWKRFKKNLVKSKMNINEELFSIVNPKES